MFLLLRKGEKGYWVHYPYLFCKSYCINLRIGLIFWEIPPCIVEF